MATQRDKTLARNVRALRERRGWTQVQLARRSGIGRRSIGNIERATGHSPTHETLQSLARTFRLETWQLLIDDTEQVIELLNLYDRLDGEQRERVLGVLARESLKST